MLHKQMPTRGFLCPGKPSLVRRIAAELPGVGWERALAVEKRFRTIEDLMIATEEELR